MIFAMQNRDRVDTTKFQQEKVIYALTTPTLAQSSEPNVQLSLMILSAALQLL
jgi:hypothetical protein